MTPPRDPGRGAATARQRAAVLFAAAARNETAGPTAQLHCLAAVEALQTATGPIAAPLVAADPDRLITEALQLLGGLEPADFADPDVLTAARHGRRALRAPR